MPQNADEKKELMNIERNYGVFSKSQKHLFQATVTWAAFEDNETHLIGFKSPTDFSIDEKCFQLTC